MIDMHVYSSDNDGTKAIKELVDEMDDDLNSIILIKQDDLLDKLIYHIAMLKVNLKKYIQLLNLVVFLLKYNTKIYYQHQLFYF